MPHIPNRRQNQRGGPQHKKQKKKATKDANTGDTEQVLRFDVQALLKRHAESAEEAKQANMEKIPTVVHLNKNDPFPETEVTVAELSSTGDGLALSPSFDHVYVVPFTTAGDRVRVKVVRTVREESYSATDLLEVLEPSPQRDDSLINCKYFAKCGGCQLQMLPYEDQLKHKKRIVEKAYANFSGLLPELIPAVRDTMGSPLQYGYRTKLTPHFPQPIRRAGADGNKPQVPPIGFMLKGRRAVMDIEECPLGTDIVRMGMKSERKRVAENLHQYNKGATLLLRESTTRVYKNRKASPSPDRQSSPSRKGRASREASPAANKDEQVIRTEYPDYIEEKRCITDQTGTSIEYVDNYKFQNKAGEFFQNNNSILTPFTQYIRDNALAPPSSSTTQPPSKIKYLLDAYSGSGLFTVTLSPLFLSSLGIDISPKGIEAARQNARANKLPNTGFAAADAHTIFKDVPYPPDKTLLVIDPPRKGCDDNFLQQLLLYGPARVVYVSCNVHTQARDVGVLVQGANVKGETVRYEIESLKGFDFFPQTGHVEGVAVLNKVVEPVKGVAAVVQADAATFSIPADSAIPASQDVRGGFAFGDI
ncbi:23S rRNA (uracil-5-)-methyltransferase RumA [Helicocarpus griseus UAMH5409]|uniref:tRNA (uracil(54)-C(5))-methyltransferase n=1 Tax=Helicocarpus griseus UAMH5409 TaxID=1447875 RepID=A0A2B7WZC5_9EURO|nr:23S rRNA (uracil-5-)-methyltransferase RumA [Helicocarpus griseus UAMH5409]